MSSSESSSMRSVWPPSWYEQALAAMPDLAFVLDEDGRFIDVLTDRHASLYVPRDRFAGRLMAEVLPEELAQTAQGLIQRCFASGNVETMEYALDMPDGPRWFEGRVSPMEETHAGKRLLVWVSRDINEQHRITIELRRSENLLRLTLASLRDALFIVNAQDTTIMECNDAAVAMFGYDLPEMLDHEVTFLHVDHEHRQRFTQTLRHSVRKEGFLHLTDFVMRRRSGEVFPTEHTVTPLHDESGQLFAWVSVVRDVSDRQRAEQELRDSEARFRALVESTSDWVWETDLQMRFVYCSPKARDIVGYAPEELLGRTPVELMTPQQQETHFRELATLELGRPIRMLYRECIHKDGHIVILEAPLIVVEYRWGEENVPITLAHYPLESWDRQRHGGLHLHGHTHSNQIFTGRAGRFHVGVDATEFAPLVLSELLDKWMRRDR